MQKQKTKKQLLKKQKQLEKKDLKLKLEKWKESIIIRDAVICQKCGKFLGIIKNNTNKHVHHIISLQAVMRKYPELLEDVNNGILLCPWCHKFASDSPHQGALEFILFFKNKFPIRYEYLIERLKFIKNEKR